MTSLFNRDIPDSVHEFLGEEIPKKAEKEGMTRDEAAEYLGVSTNFVSILTGKTARGGRLSRPYTKEKLDAYLDSRWKSDKYTKS